MKKQIKLLLLFIIAAINIQAQSNIDSLELVLKSSVHDTTKINILSTLQTTFSRKDFDKSFAYSQQLIALCKKNNADEYLSEAYSQLGGLYFINNYGLDSILNVCQKSLAITERTNQLDLKVSTINLMAVAYRKFGQTDKAFALYQEGLAIAEAEGLKLRAAQILTNLAIMLKYQGSPKKAKKYYKKAIQYAILKDEKRTLGIAYNNLAALYNDEKQRDSALIYYNKSLEIKKIRNDEVGTVMTLSNIGGIYMEQTDYKKADAYFQEANALAKKTNDTYSLAVNLSYIANSYNLQKNYPKSIETVKEQLKILEDNGDIYLTSDCYELLSANYESIGNYKEAFKYTKLFQTLNDSIFTLDKNEQIKSLEIEYDVAQKETENQLLKSKTENAQKTIRNQTFAAIGLILALIFAIGWGSFVYRANQQKKKLNEILEAKVEERTIELQSSNKNLEQANYELRTFNYIASHDIKEPIRVIGGYAGMIFRKLPANLQTSLGEHFNMIQRSTSQLYTLVEDFASYTTLSKGEIAEQQDIDLNVLTLSIIQNLQESIEKLNGEVIVNNLPTIKSNNFLLFITLKNLVENGLKYNKSEKPTVNIDYNKTATHHEIIVSDNGIGIDKAYQEQIFEMFKRLHSRGKYEGSGIGLAIVKLSMEKLNGKVSLESAEGKGSQFKIALLV